MSLVIEGKKYNYTDRHFAICESCYWTATLFEMKSENKLSCPACRNKLVTLIPLSKNEQYFYAIDSKCGLDMEFTR
jgi:hypothetical protein